MPRGYRNGNRYRWWYKETGLPGWMRFRYQSIGNPPVGHMPYLDVSAKEEPRRLEEERQMLEDELEEIQKRVEEKKKEIKEVK